ncbi:Sir2 family NAD-dependent protein deacetylase [Pseudomonas aeruginosa]|uniref:Sir2 family NAD-dependent protein deacetylase n=1 Tax=Pseudomonas aeruginosa TaxID=287 RepID=UPI00275B6DBD|nr:Sir2 family NAD-dependent protein deacetylase [Pseudomonas aeruginosa]
MRAVVELLAGARRLVIFTGAGVSAESGIPTFRDALGGLWARYDPAALATPAAFADDPALVWGWYEWRRLKVLGVQPNPAHRAIAALSGRIADTRLVTQNVDDLHERAGSRDVLHLHGSLHAPRCATCAAAYRDALPEAALREAFAAACECDLLLSVGTSGVVQPAARIPGLALEHGASVVHVNPQPVRTRHPREHCLVGPAGEMLPELLRRAFPG